VNIKKLKNLIITFIVLAAETYFKYFTSFVKFLLLSPFNSINFSSLSFSKILLKSFVLYVTICCWNKSFLSLISANAKEIKLETYFMKIRNCSRTITIWSKAISLGEMRDCFKDRIVRSGSKMPDIYKY